MAATYLPALLFLVFATVMVGVILGLNAVLGPKRTSAAKEDPFECGSDPVGSPRVRFSVKFYQAAILFLVFDIEAAFMYPWAALLPELSCAGAVGAAGACTGTPSLFGVVEMFVFAGILLVALAYVWRKRVLDWA